jgi:hypothetical protein
MLALFATRVFILKLHKKVKINTDLFWMLKYLNVNLCFIGRALKSEFGLPKTKIDRISTVRTKKMVKRERMDDQCVCKMAKEFDHFKLKPYGLTEAQKATRFLAWHSGDDIIFSEGQIFLLHN